MDIWLNWLIGFLIWIMFVLLFVLFSISLTDIVPFLRLTRGKISMDLFNYSYFPEYAPEDAYLLDTHSHTTASDGWMTPEQNVEFRRLYLTEMGKPLPTCGNCVVEGMLSMIIRAEAMPKPKRTRRKKSEKTHKDISSGDELSSD